MRLTLHRPPCHATHAKQRSMFLRERVTRGSTRPTGLDGWRSSCVREVLQQAFLAPTMHAMSRRLQTPAPRREAPRGPRYLLLLRPLRGGDLKLHARLPRQCGFAISTRSLRLCNPVHCWQLLREWSRELAACKPFPEGQARAAGVLGFVLLRASAVRGWRWRARLGAGAR